MSAAEICPQAGHLPHPTLSKGLFHLPEVFFPMSGISSFCHCMLSLFVPAGVLIHATSKM